jgi:hypothetical protein
MASTDGCPVLVAQTKNGISTAFGFIQVTPAKKTGCSYSTDLYGHFALRRLGYGRLRETVEKKSANGLGMRGHSGLVGQR